MLRFQFISSYQLESDYEILDWGQPHHGQRIHVRTGVPEYAPAYNGGKPVFNCTPEEFQRSYADVVDYIRSCPEVSPDVARAFNAFMAEQHEEARRHFIAKKYSLDDFGDAYQVKGIASYIVDRWDVDSDGHKVVGAAHWKFTDV